MRIRIEVARASRCGATPVALSLSLLELCMKQCHMISLRLDDELISLLDEYCEKEDRSRVNAIRRFLKMGLKEAQEKEEDQ
jgi:hypothetical protein